MPTVAPVPPAAAQPGRAPAGAVGVVDIVKVGGRLDPVTADFVVRAIDRAESDDGEVVVVQLDSPGSLLSPDRLDRLLTRVSSARVPVAVWVGPTGAVAHGGSARLVEAAAMAGMATRTRLGQSSSIPGSLTTAQAVGRGVVDLASATLGEFVVGLDGREVGGRVIDTARATRRDGRPSQTAAGQVRFARLGFFEGLLHSAASPQVAYLLLMLALFLVVFEFFTAGVGVAGAVGAGLGVLAAYGLAVLPTTGLGLGLIVVGMLGFSIDIQAGAPRTWTAIGAVGLTAGSLALFGDAPDGRAVGLPWVTTVLVIAGTAALLVSGMTSMLRSRFSTPTVGRDSMIGRMGEARTGIDPEGTVSLAGGLWRARTNRATPIGLGDSVRVVAIDGLLLEVEPEEGGARDAGH
ncbi:MAG: NfeD family protein [Acidimicrobiales bacterium]